LINYLIN